MITQGWQDKELDKDILNPGNKIYGPDRCLFVSRYVNTLLMDCSISRGKYPIGVYFENRLNKFTAHYSLNGKKKHLGCYDSSKEAASAYNHAKGEEIRRVAYLQTDIHVKNGLLRHAELRLNA